MSKPAKKIGSLQEIEQGEIMHVSKKKLPYKIVHGWDAKASLQCDALWKAAWLELFEQIEQTESDETKQAGILETISTEDMHWRWFDKAIAFSSDEYEWFHLHADDKPQAACLIYHPKPSALERGDIFYVEFVAVAPWNRTCKSPPPRIRGVGPDHPARGPEIRRQAAQAAPGFLPAFPAQGGTLLHEAQDGESGR